MIFNFLPFFPQANSMGEGEGGGIGRLVSPITNGKVTLYSLSPWGEPASPAYRRQELR